MAAAVNLNNEDELVFRGSTTHGQRQAGSTDAGASGQASFSAGIGVRALESGLVDAVLCVQQSRTIAFTPVPVLAAPRKRFWRQRVEQAHPLPQT